MLVNFDHQLTIKADFPRLAELTLLCRLLIILAKILNHQRNRNVLTAEPHNFLIRFTCICAYENFYVLLPVLRIKTELNENISSFGIK